MSLPLNKEEAFARLGSITREMHQSIASLGGGQFREIVAEIPNTRDRLAYVAKMTEDAANKVLNLVDSAKPQCDDLATRGEDLAKAIDKLASKPDMTLEQARGLMKTCGKYAQNTAKFASQQSAALGDIMMAQDFQDLSGQVIKKVIDIITKTEMELVQLLVESAPKNPVAEVAEVAEAAETKPAVTAAGHHELEGPQTDGSALKQDDVDDLLASLGF